MMEKKRDQAKRLKVLLATLEKTQVEFAREIEKTPQAISKYFAGGGMSMDVVQTICARYNVSYDWLMNGEGPMFRDEQEKPMQKEANLLDRALDELRNRMSFLERQLDTKDEQIRWMMERMGKSEAYPGDAAAGKERRGFQKAKNQILEPVKAFAKVA